MFFYVSSYAVSGNKLSPLSSSRKLSSTAQHLRAIRPALFAVAGIGQVQVMAWCLYPVMKGNYGRNNKTIDFEYIPINSICQHKKNMMECGHV